VLESEEFKAYFCAEFVGNELTNALGAMPALPPLFLVNVAVRALAQLPGAAAIYQAGGALAAHATTGAYGDFSGIVNPPVAVVANNQTYASLFAVIEALLTPLPVVVNRASAAALSCFLNLSIALAKRGQSTNV
jgi:hypothetical protein